MVAIKYIGFDKCYKIKGQSSTQTVELQENHTLPAEKIEVDKKQGFKWRKQVV